MRRDKITWEKKKWLGHPTLNWVCWTASIGRGRVWLFPSDKTGTNFCSSFGANSDDSFSGRLDGVTNQKEAKKAVIDNLMKYLEGGVNEIIE
jgi:hypothetical protein